MVGDSRLLQCIEALGKGVIVIVQSSVTHSRIRIQVIMLSNPGRGGLHARVLEVVIGFNGRGLFKEVTGRGFDSRRLHFMFL